MRNWSLRTRLGRTSILAGLAIVLAVAVAPAAPDTSAQATQPTPEANVASTPGSRIQVSSVAPNPIPVTSNYGDWENRRFATVYRDQKHISSGYNSMPGPLLQFTGRSQKPSVLFKKKMDSTVYLGRGYWISAHNDAGFDKNIVVTRFNEWGIPAENSSPAEFGYLRYEEQGAREGKIVTLGKMTVKLTYAGCDDSNYNWRVQILRYNDVSSSMTITNMTEKLIYAASSYDDFTKRPTPLYKRYVQYEKSGYFSQSGMRGPVTTLDNSGSPSTEFADRNDTTIYLGEGIWLGSVADNGDVTITLAKFASTGDIQPGTKPTHVDYLHVPLYNAEKRDFKLNVPGIEIDASFTGIHDCFFHEARYNLIIVNAGSK